MTELFYYSSDSTSDTKVDDNSIGSTIKTFINSVKQKLAPDKEETPEIYAGLNVFKNADGQWMWVGVFTNNFRDHDSRPEIFSAESHRRYVKSVESGEKDYPYLYLYHEPKWKIGKATVLALDEIEGDEDIVFVIAGGYIDADKSEVAERIANSGRRFQMSHGVPISEIKRNEKDMTIFDQYWSEEVSVVPYGRAANPFTTFGVINGDDEMIAQEKRNEMVQSLNLQDDSLLTTLEAANHNMAAKAKEHHEFKEKSEKSEEQPEPTNEAPVEPPAEEAVVETETPSEGDQETPDEGEDALDLEQALLTLAKNQDLAMKNQAELQQTVKSLAEQIGNLEKQLQNVEAKKEKEAETPTSKALFESLVSGIEKSAAALVNENDELAKSKPQETEQRPTKKATGTLNLGFLDKMIANGQ